MESLTRKQQAFVAAYIETGDEHRALDLAGYKGTAETKRTQLWRLMRRDAHVRAAIREQTLEALESDGPLGRMVLRDLAEKAESESVRLRAAELLLERSVGRVAEQHEHLHAHALLTPEQVIERRNALRAQLGFPALVGSSGGNATQVIDGKGSVTGLHDLSEEKPA